MLCCAISSRRYATKTMSAPVEVKVMRKPTKESAHRRNSAGRARRVVEDAADVPGNDAGASSADPCAALRARGLSADLLSPTELVAAIEARERAPRRERAPWDDTELTRACITALRRGGRLACVPRRAVRTWSPAGRPIPRELDGVSIDLGEVVVRFGHLRAPFVGHIALIADGAELPAVRLDDEARERIAVALAEELLKEVP